MKKLLMTAAVAALFLGAGELQAQSMLVAQKMQDEKPVTTYKAQEQDGFKEIKTSELPSAVKTAVERDFKGATIEKAFVNADKEYKLNLTMEGVSGQKTVFANAKGEWIKPKS